MQRILAASKQQLKDATLKQASNETRFDCAYNAIRAIADIGLLLQGYRTSRKPGHHQTSIQSLVHTLSIEAPTVIVLDGLRKQRSLSSYEGDMVTDTALEECLRQAIALMARLEGALRMQGHV